MTVVKILSISVVNLSLMANVGAGPLAVVVIEKVVEKIGDVAVSTTNTLTGGVASQSGRVTARGSVDGNVFSVAIGDNSKVHTSVRSIRGVTAKSDILTTGSVGGNLTNAAIGYGAESTKSIGSNGN